MAAHFERYSRWKINYFFLKTKRNIIFIYSKFQNKTSLFLSSKQTVPFVLGTRGEREKTSNLKNLFSFDCQSNSISFVSTPCGVRVCVVLFWASCTTGNFTPHDEHCCNFVTLQPTPIFFFFLQNVSRFFFFREFAHVRLVSEKLN